MLGLAWLAFRGDTLKFRGFLKFAVIWLLTAEVAFGAGNYAFLYQVQPLSNKAQKRMLNTTWHAGCPVPLSDLVSVQVRYWDFQQKNHMGELIVNKKLAMEVVDIFRGLYYQHFPIASMLPMEAFAGDDQKAMAANNSSMFDCRVMTADHLKFSRHSYGAAIDINPWQNPYVEGSEVKPPQGRNYLRRLYLVPGMIGPDTAIYDLFKQKGWVWGGDWTEPKDYQHFEKPLN
jgi:hypothetical protein